MAAAKNNKSVKNGKNKKKPQGRALALPGESAVSKALINDAVVDLNRIYVTKGLETAIEVGTYVLNQFFGGTAANFRERGNGHVSFRQLGRREDLRVSWQFIWNAVAVVGQMSEIGTDVGSALPFSHHKLLLGVKDPSKKVKLAKTAVAKGLGKRALETLVKAARKQQGPDSKAGRPPLPAFVKAFTVLKKAVDMAEGEAISEASFAHYSKAQARELVAEVEKQIKVLEKVVAGVRSVAG